VKLCSALLAALMILSSLTPALSVPPRETDRSPYFARSPYAVPRVAPVPLAKVPPRVKKTSLTLLDWNIQVGSDAGMFKNGWKRRKRLLAKVLQREMPDILCTQEALKEQIDFIQTEVPGYSYVGVGRDDGKQEGEHCAIFYSKRLELLDKGNFWLSDTPDSPENTWDAIFKRICTWARFRDLATGNKFCIFNTHFPLIPEARDKAVKLLLNRMIIECTRGNMILVGDFNCEPGSGPWKAIEKAGFTDAEFALTKKPKRSKTYHLYGKPSNAIDAVFLPSNVRVLRHRIVNDIVGNRYPSDHFGTHVEFEFMARKSR